MVILKEVIGSGSERDVYRHPDFPDRVVKIKKSDAHLDRNAVEYALCLTKNLSTHAGIPKMFGWVETNLGAGLQYQLVCDACGTPSRTLKQAVRTGILTPSRATTLLAAFFDTADRRGLIVYDPNLDNFLFRPDSDRIIMVDGFGPLYWNYRLRLRSRFAILARKKIRQARSATFLEWERWSREVAATPGAN